MVCKQCGTEFVPKLRGRKNSGFCCKNCADKFRIKNIEPRFQKVCEYCGREYKTNAVKQRYCSYDCAGKSRSGRTVYNKQCSYCGCDFETITAKQKYCSATCASRYHADEIRGEYFCEYCGKPRHSDHPNRNKFCSRECALKSAALEQLPVKLEKERIKAQKLMEMQHRICPYCGKEFAAKNGHQKYCSYECCYELHLEQTREQWAEKFVPKEFYCAECGKRVITELGLPKSVYCSDECSSRAAKRVEHDNRRVHMQKAFIEKVTLKEIYERDNGICAICGLPVPNDNSSANAWGATRDHIEPISRGGLHKKDNCQLAHRMCNSLKLDTLNEYRIDWKEKLKENPKKWSMKLDDLWEQLRIE